MDSYILVASKEQAVKCRLTTYSSNMFKKILNLDL